MMQTNRWKKMRTRVPLGLPALLCGCVMVVPVVPTANAPTPGETPRAAAQCPVGSAAQATRFEPNAAERELGRMLEQDPGQRRERIVFNPILARVARQRAQDMAARSYFDHTDPDGLGANTHVTRAGYRLPDHYDRSPAGNNIESIGGGYQSAWEAWEGLVNSEDHRTHLLGLQAFYREQSEYGVGYARAPDSEFEHYWVLLIAKPAC